MSFAPAVPTPQPGQRLRAVPGRAWNRTPICCSVPSTLPATSTGRPNLGAGPSRLPDSSRQNYLHAAAGGTYREATSSRARYLQQPHVDAGINALWA